MRCFITKILCIFLQVVDVLLNECNVIYECKICFNMFRSIANLISHKRSFCKNRIKNIVHVYQNEDGEPLAKEPEKIAVVQPEPIETVFPSDDFELKDYSPSLELLKEAGILSEIQEKPLVETLKPVKHAQSKLPDIVSKLRALQETRAESYSESNTLNMFLEPLQQTSQAVFQTYGPFNNENTMGQKYVDLLNARQLGSAFVGPDNKIVEPGDTSTTWTPESSEYSFQMKPAPFQMKPTSYPCLKCKVSYSRIYNTVNHMKNGKLKVKE